MLDPKLLPERLDDDGVMFALVVGDVEGVVFLVVHSEVFDLVGGNVREGLAWLFRRGHVVLRVGSEGSYVHYSCLDATNRVDHDGQPRVLQLVQPLGGHIDSREPWPVRGVAMVPATLVLLPP